MTNEINTAKYQNAILFFIENCNNEYLGRVKLNKLLYYLDFLHYRDVGTSVTGDVYICAKYGPVPNQSEDVRKEMESSNMIKELKVEGSSNHNYEPLTKVDEAVFTKKELSLLKDISTKFKFVTKDEIVARTHLEAPWFYSEMNEEIDYKYSDGIDCL